MSILVAEDDPCDALLLEQAFCQASMHVPIHFVDTGQEVLEYLRGEPPFANRAAHPLPTLLLLDLDLLRNNEFEMLKWLRQQPALDGLRVVAFGSSVDAEDLDRAQALGADAHLLKPEDAGAMIEAVEQLKSDWLAQ
ncbi:MAG TPA: response regulator [Candidatus Sulfotelmatobacter sp.]|nr:response regulator [Candidatus Sulfotelmatobacter sp.]HWI57753.1 response regulator [Bacillota bacterium]